jgi:ABC-type multidrug transport system permease subunit
LDYYLLRLLVFCLVLAVVSGMLIALIALFSGFMIKRVDMPDFWTFL